MQVGTAANSRGGSVNIAAGDSTSSIGGSIHLKSGLSESTSSGDIVIESPDVTSLGSLGPSGSITMSTGHANKASGSCK